MISTPRSASPLTYSSSYLHIYVFFFLGGCTQEASDNEEEERDEEEEENTDYLTDSNKENETDEENNVRALVLACSSACLIYNLPQ